MPARHPAAFINALAEEGTKAEAIEWLQKTWDELCDIRERCATKALEQRCERGTPWDLACVTIADAIRKET